MPANSGMVGIICKLPYIGMVVKHTSHILSVCCCACPAAIYVWCDIVYLLTVLVCYS